MATKARKRRFRLPSRMVRRQWLEGYLFAAPFIIGFFAFIAFPMLYSIVLAFQSWDLLSPPRFVGLKNIVRMPLVAWSVVWQRVLHPEFGILNEMLGWFGISPKNWLFDPALTKPAFIFMSFWMIGRQMVIFIAGLGNIPESLLEAASIDGAGPFRKLTGVIIPLMTPLIFYNMVVAIINSFQSFIPAQIMTEGGPENATLFAVLNIYRNGFQYFNMGYASALAWEFFVIVVVFTVAQFYVSQRWVYYEA